MLTFREQQAQINYKLEVLRERYRAAKEEDRPIVSSQGKALKIALQKIEDSEQEREVVSILF